ncbi:AGAP002854-PA-like protein [Anopheles sinensis]|uniref:AGAP002854-PA-like protein n=1 Tax=Anopheles sinensis TaxID=74873 RepID=A0A084VK11_ANOSI|nr:AGAP002854-PA-like protein [Anopheles sinensis]
MWSLVFLTAIAITSLNLQPCEGLLKVIADFDRWEHINGSDVFNVEMLRVRKYNRTLSVLNGTIGLLIDLSNTYEYGVSFSRSAQGNNQYDAYPMKLASRPFCEFIRTHYRDYQHFFLNSSNLPYVTEEGLCPFPKGDYWMKDLYIESSAIPVVVPEGFWRATLELRNIETGVEAARGAMYVKITKEYI